MPTNLFRELLASDVLSGRRHEVPWEELVSTQFSAEDERKSWSMFLEWVAEHEFEWHIDVRGHSPDGIFVEFTGPSDSAWRDTPVFCRLHDGARTSLAL
jgi:hypothetical protein